MSGEPSPAWAEIEAIFFDALERPREQRKDWIRGAASPEIAAEVLSLVEAHEQAESAEAGRRVGP